MIAPSLLARANALAEDLPRRRRRDLPAGRQAADETSSRARIARHGQTE